MTNPIDDLNSLVLPENASDLVEHQVEFVYNRLWMNVSRQESPTVTVDRVAHDAAIAAHNEAATEVSKIEARNRRFFGYPLFVSSAALAVTSVVALIFGTNDAAQALMPATADATAFFPVIPGAYTVIGIFSVRKATRLRKRLPERPTPNCMYVGHKAAAAYRHLAAAVDEVVEMDDVSSDVMWHLHAARAQADEYLPLIEALSEDEQFTSVHTEDLVRTAAEVLVTVSLIKHAAREREEMLSAGMSRTAPPSLAAAREAVLGEIRAIREVADANAPAIAADSSTNRALPHTTDS
jgi:hypothetical protein